MEKSRPILMIITDAIIINIVLYLTFITLGWELKAYYFLHITSLTLLTLFLKNTYIKKHISSIDIIFKTTASILVAYGMFILIAFTFRMEISRKIVLISGFANMFAISTAQVIFHKKLTPTSNTIIIGADKKGQRIAKEIQKDYTYNLLGFLDDDIQKSHVKGIKLLGRISELKYFMPTLDEVIIALPSKEKGKIAKIINQCSNKIKFKIAPDLYEEVINDIYDNKKHPLIESLVEPIPKTEAAIKRIMDITGASAGLIFASPIMLLIALAIKIDSKGPIIYKQKRLGKNCQEFEMYKFRSMIQNAEKKKGPTWAKKHDSRETKVGRFIRSKSLDELPQMINILKGDMSIVGPRPERLYFSKKFAKHIAHWNERLQLKPGLTGLAAINGDYELKPRQKLRYDLEYLKNYSIMMDLQIIMRTFFMEVIKKREY